MLERKHTMSIPQVLFSFKGRLCRSELWIKGILTLLPINILINILLYSVAMAEDVRLAFAAVYFGIILWPSLAFIIKRLHDRNRSAWFLFIYLIPIIGSLWLLIEIYFLKGTDGPNRFGADPLQTETQTAKVSDEQLKRLLDQHRDKA